MLAFFVESVAGFGSTVVAVALAAHLVPIDRILPVFVPVNVVLSLYFVARYRRDVDVPALTRRVLPLMGAGVVAGLLAFDALKSSRAIRVGFGAFVVALAAVELVAHARRRTSERARALPSPARAALLLAAGVIHGIYATGGPMVVYVASREIDGKRAFRATLSALWLALNLVLVAGYTRAGLLTASSLAQSAALMVPLGIGLALGEWAHHRVDERAFRVGVYALLLVAGLSLAVRALG